MSDFVKTGRISCKMTVCLDKIPQTLQYNAYKDTVSQNNKKYREDLSWKMIFLQLKK